MWRNFLVYLPSYPRRQHFRGETVLTETQPIMKLLLKGASVWTAVAFIMSTMPAEAQNTRVRPKAAPIPPSIDLFAYENGAHFVQMPDGLELANVNTSPLNFIDGALQTDLAVDVGQANVFVLELSERTELRRVAFDSAFQGHNESSPRSIKVEISDTSPTDGFTTILSTNLRMATDNQSFAMDPRALPVGRWVRLTLMSNFGRERIALNGFRGYGRQLTNQAAAPNLTGSYMGASGIGAMNITQTGNQVTGCYEYQNSRFTGVVQGRVVKLNIQETDPSGSQLRLEGLFNLSENGRLIGYMREPGPVADRAYATFVSAQRERNRAGSCGN
jgi:hypothetical protein